MQSTIHLELTKCDADQNFCGLSVGFVVVALWLLVSKSAGLSLECQVQQVEEVISCM